MWQPPELSPSTVHLLEMIKEQKSEAERSLADGNLDHALNAYTEAIEIAFSNPNVCGELFKLYSNRSLVQYKMSNFSEALSDANQCIGFNSAWPKGYWRRAAAMKRLEEDYEALISLTRGFILSVEQKSDENIFDFTTALIPIICRLKDDPRDILNDIEEVQLNNTMIVKLISHFAKRNQWEEISLMVLGIHEGLSNGFDGLAWGFDAYDFTTKDVCIKPLVQSLYNKQEKDWRFKLASKLSNHAKVRKDLQAFISVIQSELSEPAFHTGIKNALETGNVYLLKFFFENYDGIGDEKDAKDDYGNTGLHLLVQSDKKCTTLGETIMNMLINYGCSVNISNKSGRRPIDYLNPADPGYIILSNAEAEISVEEMEKKIPEMRKAGHDFMKQKNYRLALQKYTDAINLCYKNSELRNELPALLTNRSKAYSDNEQYVMALKDAETSIKVDSKWVKAYWRKAIILKFQKKYKESFGTFVTGYKQTIANEEENETFLSEASAVLLKLNIDEVQIALTGLTNSKWKEMIATICKGNDGHSLRVFVLGTSEFLQEKETSYDEDKATVAMSDSIVFSSIFPFLRQYKGDDIIKEWTIKLIETLINKQGGLLNVKGFKDDSSDTSLHAAVKFSLIIENVVILNHLPTLEKDHSEIIDSNGDSILHIITKQPPTKNTMVLVMVTKVLLEKGFSTSVKDNDGKIPIQYLKPDDKELFKVLSVGKDEPGETIQMTEIFDFEDSKDPLELKKQGNAAFKQKQYEAARHKYTKAIAVTPSENKSVLSRLYCNRAECWLKLQMNDKAMEDTKSCISYEQTWFKGFYRLGKVLRVMGKHQDSMEAFIVSLNLLKPGALEEIEILSEIMVEYSGLYQDNAKLLQLKLPVSEELWTRTIYYLVCENNLEAAKMGFLRQKMFPTIAKVEVNLKPLCNIGHIEKHCWIIDMILHLLIAGSSYTSLEVDKGDTYIHAVVKMTLVSGVRSLLKYVLQMCSIPNQEVDKLDNNNNTPLHVAARYSSSPEVRYIVIMMLLQSEANTLLKNKDGKLAVDMVPRGEHIISEIQQAMKFQREFKKQLKKQKLHEQTEREIENVGQGQVCTINKKKQVDKKEANEKTKISSTCPDCKQHIEQCQAYLSKPRNGKAYKALASVLMHGNDTEDHKEIHAEAVQRTIDILVKIPNAAIPTEITQIPIQFYQTLIDNLACSKNYLKVVQLVKAYCEQHEDNAKLAKNINLADLIQTISVKKQSELPAIIGIMLASGAKLEEDGKMCIAASVERQYYNLLCILFEKGANPAHLSLLHGDTPVHAALSIALKKDIGNFSVFNKLHTIYERDPETYKVLNPNQQDSEGDGLFHKVIRMKYNNTIKQALELLCKIKVDISLRNKEGKLPQDYCTNVNDRRLQILRQTFDVLPKQTKTILGKTSRSSTNRHKAKIDKESKADDQKIGMTSGDVSQNNSENKMPQLMNSDEHPKAKKSLDIKQKIQEMILCLPKSKYYDFMNTTETKEELNGITVSGAKKLKKIDSSNDSQQAEPKAKSLAVNETNQSKDNDVEFETELPLKADLFDDLDWEVDCTPNVWKTLKDTHLPLNIKKRTIKIIQELASGHWKSSYSKTLSNVPSNLQLYEAKLSKSARIIWEVVPTFSPRLNERLNIHVSSALKEEQIYSEIIRVWDIVLNHDKIFSSIERIKRCYERGKQCVVQKKLKKIKHPKCDKRFPEQYIIADSNSEWTDCKDEITLYYPPASPNEGEYHIQKFYSFSSNLAYHILSNMNTAIDFPFRVTELEHAIINLPFDTPILLLGRSGTGKTTCCLYRLYTEFTKYWHKAEEAMDALLPSGQETSEEGATSGPVDQEEVKDDDAMCDDEIVNKSEEAVTEEEIEEEDGHTQLYDHLHQIFITKNDVLCSEVQRSFRELSHASSISIGHIQMEKEPIPTRLQDVDHLQFPLFVTSKTLLLMLDASVGPPYFFERSDDGNLKVNVKGWTNEQSRSGFLNLLSEDSDDGEENNELSNDVHGHHKKRPRYSCDARLKLDPRREVTYSVFCEELWPKIAKEFKKVYHPSLVWTEIVSFIKGSYEALSNESGFLSVKEYIDIGKKRAPNFSGNRDHVYQLFQRYQRLKRTNFLFDETDLVRDIFKRLKRGTWVIHQVFVDETQDFTQAELYLLLHICHNPNQMFLTGDTAQNIIRGVSFRFSDLKSLFLYFIQDKPDSKEALDIQIPHTVHQLTHNYRSHKGILSLASSILDIMVHFFPESFDKLQKDQGMFDGPKPVLLESTNDEHLVEILRRNKQQNSSIEFGANQAILVVDDGARQKMPKALQRVRTLTIPEAKGLEFNDILLYNFFKDSQATEEWRVITGYLEELAADSNPDPCHLEIDLNVLQEEIRPRKLKFNPERHKILISELKNLYTAITRARVKVWIFDEDTDRRSPMFEYFKARKLTTDKAEEITTQNSSKDDWVKSGKDLMKCKLYKFAEEDFLKGGQEQLAKEAHAYHLKKLAMETNYSSDFLSAAEHFLDVRIFEQAEICLGKAKETELLANLYEQTGKLRQAAEMYRQSKCPKEGSKCYERLGMFNLAIDTLCECELYEEAISSLNKYDMLMKTFREPIDTPIPSVLRKNGPSKSQTHENLNYKAANKQHLSGNKVGMMSNLDQLTFKNKLDFLKSHGYIKDAAQMLMKKGMFEESAELCTLHGKTDYAIDAARKAGDMALLCRCLLVHVHLTNQQLKKDEKAAKEKMLPYLKEVIKISFKNGLHNARGEAYLLRGEISKTLSDIRRSWRAFNHNTPFRNDAGQLDCTNWITRNVPLTQLQTCGDVVYGIRKLFEVLKVLVIPDSSDEEKLLDVFSYFGFHISSNIGEFLKVYPMQKPRAMKILKKDLKLQSTKKSEFDVPIEFAKSEICKYLLKRGKRWFDLVHEAICGLRQQKVKHVQYKFSIEKDKVETKDQGIMLELLQVDCLLIKLNTFVRKDANRIRKNTPSEINKDVGAFLSVASDDSLRKSCWLLIQDLMNQKSLSILKTQNWNEVRDMLRKDNIIKEQILKYLRASVEDLKTTNAKRKENINAFLKCDFLSRYFGLKFNVLDIVWQFENYIHEEHAANVANSDVLKQTLQPLGFIVIGCSETRQTEPVIQCFARLFCEGLHKLMDEGEVSVGLTKFSQFISVLIFQNEIDLLPDLHDFIMWIEFYSLICMYFVAKFHDTSNAFYVPSSYIYSANFLSSAFDASGETSTFSQLQRYMPNCANADFATDVQTSFKRILSILCERESGINLKCLAFKVSSDNSLDYLLVERVLVFYMACLCNIGHIIDIDSEIQIMKPLLNIQLEDDCPSRLKTAISSVQKANGQFELANAWSLLLLDRDEEEIMCCTINKENGLLHYEPVRHFTNFKMEFQDQSISGFKLNPTAKYTSEDISIKDIIEDMIIGMSEEAKSN